VFCASLADVFDNQVPMQWRRELFELINHTPHLDWLLLTKRPQNIRKMVEEVFSGFFPWPWPNVWLGITAENQEEYDRRWPHLAAVPAHVRFISYEPALGPLSPVLYGHSGKRPDWIICGGESGGHAREMNPEWARDLRDACHVAGVAFFFKQMTRKAPIPDDLMVRQFPSN
jgi:protein gp37